MEDRFNIDYDKLRKNPLLANKTDDELYEIELKKRENRAKKYASNKLVTSLLAKMVSVRDENGNMVQKSFLDVMHDPIIDILLSSSSENKEKLEAYKILSSTITKFTNEPAPTNMIQVNQNSGTDSSSQEIVFSNKIKGLND